MSLPREIIPKAKRTEKVVSFLWVVKKSLKKKRLSYSDMSIFALFEDFMKRRSPDGAIREGPEACGPLAQLATVPESGREKRIAQEKQRGAPAAMAKRNRTRQWAVQYGSLPTDGQGKVAEGKHVQTLRALSVHFVEIEFIQKLVTSRWKMKKIVWSSYIGIIPNTLCQFRRFIESRRLIKLIHVSIPVSDSLLINLN